MTLFRHSRHQYSLAIQDPDGNWFLTDREPFPYKAYGDNFVHKANGNEAWADIAGKRYNIRRPAGLWWLVADFQPVDNPVIDPTLKVGANRPVIVPSTNTVSTFIFNERRKRFA